MKSSLSLVVITKNAEELLDESLSSVQNLVDEIIIVDDYSKDNTLSIAKNHGATIYCHTERDLGKQKTYGIKKAKGEWILILDADEIVSKELKKEIKSILSLKNRDEIGYVIPYQNHFLGRPISYGGENYKMLRLFKKKYAVTAPSLVHEKVVLKKGKIGYLKHRIYHYSYRSLVQMYRKFTDYAIRDKDRKIMAGEHTSLKKVILYPIHMFWARFIEDKGYKDGLFRIPLDLGFAYMEFLTYFLMIFS